MTSPEPITAQPVAKCACCLSTGFIAEEIDAEGWCLTCADNAENCDCCGERNAPDWLNGVASWGEDRLCDDCFEQRPASRGRDPDGWKMEAGR
jgi:hypothetical protein